MRARDAWSQDVVLKALCDQVARGRAEGQESDFIVATGDIADAGKAEEYALAASFFDELSAASGVPKERVFCIPGNHDVDRGRHKLCFLGARAHLQNQTLVDALLAGGEDLETLLKRQENYATFQAAYFTGQHKDWTGAGLGYVSRLTIDDVRLAIVGLNSAWLAEGGLADHGKLLVGERQVIDAMNLSQEGDEPPHIIIGMAHHPLHLLQDFDRRPIQARIQRVCHFFHCGHLHAPEIWTAGNGGSGCLMLDAGASFETRESPNTYSRVALDLLLGKRTVTTHEYDPSKGAFSVRSAEEYEIEVAPAGTCSVRELAQAIGAYRAALGQWAHYLSALLLDKKAELPIRTFGSLALLLTLPDNDLRRRTVAFVTFKNALRVLHNRIPLADILVAHGTAIDAYGVVLEQVCSQQPAFRARLDQHERDARTLAAAEPRESFSHTLALLGELATAEDWGQLREQAQRHLNSPDLSVAVLARRLLALSLGHSDYASDRSVALLHYRSLLRDGHADAADVGNLATLLLDSGQKDEAQATILGGLRRFAAGRTDFLLEVGQKIVEATGDRGFRKEMEAVMAESEREKRG
jgi:hypothetical protein